METIQKVISAKDALNRTKQNPLTLNDVMGRIKDGIVEISYIGIHFPDELKVQLFDLGYRYRKHIDPIGLTCHVISWDE